MRWLKLVIVIVGALIVTAVGIDAADTLRGASTTMLGQLIQTEETTCPTGMVEVSTAGTFTCVDQYEAGVGPHCPNKEVEKPLQTATNLGAADCLPVSKAAVIPWGFVTREQASQLCARAGKRLPTAAEWYYFAQDTAARNCAVQVDKAGKTGANAACVSAHGVSDTVGNVWEWVSDDVIEGSFAGRALPPAGYVVQVDKAGVATVTGESEMDSHYEGDYFWSEATGAYGMIRGGFYGSQTDAGVFTVQAATLPTFTGAAIGFRCVR